MAEAFLRDLAGERFDVTSAGYEEAPEICPDAVEAMREVGIDISGQHTKRADQFLGERFSCVVTLCNREIEPTCPIFPAAIWRLKWPVENPATAQSDDERRAITRRVRHEIQRYVTEFVREQA
jgi:arsenate reductase (thioredoxin)